MRGRKDEAVPVGVPEQLVLAPSPPVPHRTDGVYDEPGLQIPAAGDHRLPRGTFSPLFAELPAFLEYAGAPGAVDRVVHTAPTEKG